MVTDEIYSYCDISSIISGTKLFSVCCLDIKIHVVTNIDFVTNLLQVFLKIYNFQMIYFQSDSKIPETVQETSVTTTRQLSPILIIFSLTFYTNYKQGDGKMIKSSK